MRVSILPLWFDDGWLVQSVKVCKCSPECVCVCVCVRTHLCVTSVVYDLGAQYRGHLQHSDKGLIHGGEGERRHAVTPRHLADVHRAVA